MARHPVMKMILHDSDSDDELEMVTTYAIEMNKLNSEESSDHCRGSIQGHSVIFRNRVQGHKRLYRDYFAEPPIYPLNLFQRRFRMNQTFSFVFYSWWKIMIHILSKKKMLLEFLACLPFKR